MISYILHSPRCFRPRVFFLTMTDDIHMNTYIEDHQELLSSSCVVSVPSKGPRSVPFYLQWRVTFGAENNPFLWCFVESRFLSFINSLTQYPFAHLSDSLFSADQPFVVHSSPLENSSLLSYNREQCIIIWFAVCLPPPQSSHGENWVRDSPLGSASTSTRPTSQSLSSFCQSPHHGRFAVLINKHPYRRKLGTGPQCPF